eukprot:3940631-Prymnesium_polylepis.1
MPRPPDAPRPVCGPIPPAVLGGGAWIVVGLMLIPLKWSANRSWRCAKERRTGTIPVACAPPPLSQAFITFTVGARRSPLAHSCVITAWSSGADDEGAPTHPGIALGRVRAPSCVDLQVCVGVGGFARRHVPRVPPTTHTIFRSTPIELSTLCHQIPNNHPRVRAN